MIQRGVIKKHLHKLSLKPRPPRPS